MQGLKIFVPGCWEEARSCYPPDTNDRHGKDGRGNNGRDGIAYQENLGGEPPR